MIECKIKFENNNFGTFYSGSIINGSVEIVVDKLTAVRCILLIINGEADVYWTENEGTGDDRKSVTYSANDNYFNTITCLYGSQIGNTVTIDPGCHLYKFTCQLPSELPSSVEGHCGKIRYSAKVVFDRPWKFNKTITTGITIIKITDLNHENPQIRLPSTSEIQKQFCCCCCISQPLIIEATIPKSGFVSGETILVKTSLCNASGKPVQRLKVSLNQIINAKCDSGKSTTQTISLTKSVIDSIKNSRKEEFYTNLIIPPIPPTCNESVCRIVQVNYEVHVKACINGLHIPPVVKIPIIIGNIPLNSNDKNYSQASQSTNFSSSSPITAEVFAAEFGLPPPTYEEATYIEKVNMNVNEKHPIADGSYLPRYPVYHFNPSCPSYNT